MQNAKDTFYEALRDRLHGINAERTVVLRGVTRPAVMVTENELLTGVTLPDCFHLTWTSCAVEGGELPLVTQRCEIEYETAGSASGGGMDRGRALSAMDAELRAALGQAPRNVAKKDYSGLASGDAVATMKTNIWWGPLAWSDVKAAGDRLARTATLAVMSYREAGEL